MIRPGSRILVTGASRQIAAFVPRGLWGRVYWYGVAPLHHFVFPGMLDGIATEAAGSAAAADARA